VTHTDGTVLGVVLDGATEEEIREFDSLLKEFSALREQSPSEQTQEVGVAQDQEVGVASSEDAQWGDTVSKVCQSLYNLYVHMTWPVTI